MRTYAKRIRIKIVFKIINSIGLSTSSYIPGIVAQGTFCVKAFGLGKQYDHNGSFQVTPMKDKHIID